MQRASPAYAASRLITFILLCCRPRAHGFRARYYDVAMSSPPPRFTMRHASPPATPLLSRLRRYDTPCLMRMLWRCAQYAARYGAILCLRASPPPMPSRHEAPLPARACMRATLRRRDMRHATRLRGGSLPRCPPHDAADIVAAQCAQVLRDARVRRVEVRRRVTPCHVRAYSSHTMPRRAGVRALCSYATPRLHDVAKALRKRCRRRQCRHAAFMRVCVPRSAARHAHACAAERPYMPCLIRRACA